MQPERMAASAVTCSENPAKTPLGKPANAGSMGCVLCLLGTLGELHAKGVDLYLHQQGLDTSTTSGRAMFQMMGVFSEFERAMIQERVKAGLARAKEDGVTLGRPTLETSDPLRAAKVRSMRAEGVGVRKTLGVGVGTVLRLSA
jgi:DNA invertase Pin-like site-specific DNA recombinase